MERHGSSNSVNSSWRRSASALTADARGLRGRLRTSIRSKFGLALGLVAALAVLLITAVQSVYEVQELRTRALEQDEVAAKLVAAHVDDAVTNALQELALVAADPVLIAQVMTDDVAAMDTRLEAMISGEPDFTAIVVINNEARVRAISLTDKKLFDSDYSDQLHVQIALGQGVPGIGQPRRGLITGLPIVPLGVPIRASDGRLVGVLQGSLSLDRLTEQLNRV